MPPSPVAATPSRAASPTPAVIILGADTLLAARPASPGQLANACYAVGYSAVIPSSWGDELVAAGCLREIAARGQGSVVLCSCPHVAERMRRVESLLPHLLPMASPPVAAARYLRARAGQQGVHITYVGDCPSGADPAIDRHATPGALLRSLAKRGIDPTTQPAEVEERLLRDGRRFYSLPGGAPAPNWLYVEKRGYTLIEPGAPDFLAEVAFRVSKKERRVVDLAPRLGCSCSGAVVGQPWTEARDSVTAVEPPRAVHEILDHDVPVDLSASLEPWTGSATDGETTLPVPLGALAALYTPDVETSTVRSVPPPPLPRTPSVFPPPSIEPPTVRREIAPIGQVLDAPENAPVALEQPANVRPRRADPTTAPIKPFDDGVDDLRPNDAGRSAVLPEPATWPGVGRRPPRPSSRGLARGTGSQPVATETHAAARGRWGVIIVSLVVVSIGAATLAIVFLGPSASPLAAGSMLLSRLRTTRPGISAPSTSSASAHPPVPVGSDTESVDTTASPMPTTPDLPRLPIGPLAVPSAAIRAMRSPPVSLDTALSSRLFHPNPAPVATPGAAPIPRGAPPGATPPPPLERVGLPRPPRPAPVDLIAIRAEIARRRHRVDSLRQVVDSLSHALPNDSTQ